jgi:uncharacterized protein (TIGR03435 family)
MVETDNLADLARLLNGPEFDLPVVDRTGLQGNFNIYLKGAPLITCGPQDHCGKEDPTVPSLDEALQRLGLKLERRRDKIEYLVVDSGDRIPTEN